MVRVVTGATDSEALWRGWSARLRAFIAGRVDDPDEVDDILQTVFLRIHGALAEVQDSDRLLSWIYQIARNTIIDHYRAAPRRRELVTDQLPELSDPGTAEPEDADEVRRQLAGCVEPMLGGLPPHYRQALELTELGGMTQRAAAAQAGVSVPGMKSRVQRARRQLLGMLHECCVLTLDGRGAPIECTRRCHDC